MSLTVERLMTEYGYSREASFLGCVRTCIKCGQMVGLGRFCGGAR